MQRFEFKYGPLLKKRQILEDQMKQMLAEVYAKKNRFEQRLVDIEAGIQECYDQINSLDGVNPAFFVILDTQIRYKEEEKDLIRKELMKLATEEALAKEKLGIAHREKRVIEILKEKKWEAYQEEYKKEEMKTLDEIAMVQQYFNKVPK